MNWIGGINMLRRIRGIKKNLLIYLGFSKNLSIFVCASKGQSIKTTDQG
jgi:hypothetical protein